MRPTGIYRIVGVMAAIVTASDFAEMGMNMHLARDLGIVPRATLSNLQVFPLILPHSQHPFTNLHFRQTQIQNVY